MSTLIEDFLNEKKANGVKDITIDNISKSLERLDRFKSIDSCTEKDLKTYFASLECSERTKELYKIYIKGYFKWMRLPDKVAWIKARKIKTEVQEEDLLTPDEVKSLLNAADNSRDKAIISILDESGGRISEVINLNIKDLVKTDYGFKMRIRNGKTGSRDVSLINSVPYIIQWINIHPFKNNPDAPLFVNIGQRAHNKRFTPFGFRRNLRIYVKRAGIKKRVHPHLFRHGAMTSFAQSGMQESILRRLAGWSGSSSMPEIYIHVGNKDVEKAQLQMHRKVEIQKKEIVNNLSKECPQCHKMIPVDAQLCDCGAKLDLSSIVRRSIEENAELKERLVKRDAEFDELKLKQKWMSEDIRALRLLMESKR